MPKLKDIPVEFVIPDEVDLPNLTPEEALLLPPTVLKEYDDSFCEWLRREGD